MESLEAAPARTLAAAAFAAAAAVAVAAAAPVMCLPRGEAFTLSAGFPPLLLDRLELLCLELLASPQLAWPSILPAAPWATEDVELSCLRPPSSKDF